MDHARANSVTRPDPLDPDVPTLRVADTKSVLGYGDDIDVNVPHGSSGPRRRLNTLVRS
jgi:hypothetical protein